MSGNGKAGEGRGPWVWAWVCLAVGALVLGVFEWIDRRQPGSELPVPVDIAAFVVMGGLFLVLLSRRSRAQAEAKNELDLSEKRYQAFIQNSSEGIWRFESRVPIPVDASPDDQIEIIYEHGFLAECNVAMARMYGFESPDDLVGAPLAALVPREDPNNIEYLKAFIAAGHRIEDAESVEVGRDGGQLHFLNSLVASVENGQITQVWGTQRDITPMKKFQSEIERLNSSLEHAYDDTLESWTHALDLRDHETEGHSKRVTELTVKFAKHLGVPDEQMRDIRRGALLHDVGKIGIPDSILHKPGSLDDREWEVMRRHPGYAVDWLSRIEYLRPALDIPHYHHERWDGSGYPAGLVGLGLEFARQYSAMGDRVIATCRQGSAELESLGLETVYLDLSKSETIDSAREEIGKLTDRIDILINNAGVAHGGEWKESESWGSLTVDGLMRVVQVNSAATLVFTQACVDLVKKGHEPRIAFLSSRFSQMGARDPWFANNFGYSMSKVGLNLFAKTLSMLLKDDGVRMVSLDPGWASTDMGGPDAFLTPAAAVEGMVRVLEGLSEEQNGAYVSWEGEVLTY